MWIRILVISIVLLGSTACTTTSEPPFYGDKTPIQVTGTVKDFCAECEMMSSDPFVIEGETQPSGAGMDWVEDIIEVTIDSPERYRGKIIEIRNESGNEISELWKKKGSSISFVIEMQFLESPFITKNGTHETISYVTKEMDESIKTAHIKSSLTTPGAAAPSA